MNEGGARTAFDLDAYFARIGHAGARTPDLATLSALHALHPAAIPFENLDPLLGRPVPLDVAALQAKLVGSRRGGYCYEQNTLFAAALEALGFTVTRLAARVRWLARSDAPDEARTHMLMRVELDDGPYLADVGFGAHLLAAPLRLQPDVVQPTPAGELRLVGTGETYTLQTRLPKGWQDVYRFSMEPQLAADIEVANWFSATHPASRFRTHLIAERLTPQSRVDLFDRRLRSRHADGRVETEVLTGPGALADALERAFAITPPADPAEIWARLPPTP